MEGLDLPVLMFMSKNPFITRTIRCYKCQMLYARPTWDMQKRTVTNCTLVRPLKM